MRVAHRQDGSVGRRDLEGCEVCDLSEGRPKRREVGAREDARVRSLYFLPAQAHNSQPTTLVVSQESAVPSEIIEVFSCTV